MSDESERFVIKRLRSKPVEYTVTIRHFAMDGEWMMSVNVSGAGDDDENRRRVASDLSRASEIIEGSRHGQ